MVQPSLSKAKACENGTWGFFAQNWYVCRANPFSLASPLFFFFLNIGYFPCFWTIQIRSSSCKPRRCWKAGATAGAGGSWCVRSGRPRARGGGAQGGAGRAGAAWALSGPSTQVPAPLSCLPAVGPGRTKEHRVTRITQANSLFRRLPLFIFNYAFLRHSAW